MKEIQRNGEFVPLLKWKIWEEELKKPSWLILYDIDEWDLYYGELSEEFNDDDMVIMQESREGEDEP